MGSAPETSSPSRTVLPEVILTLSALHDDGSRFDMDVHQNSRWRPGSSGGKVANSRLSGNEEDRASLPPRHCDSDVGTRRSTMPTNRPSSVPCP